MITASAIQLAIFVGTALGIGGALWAVTGMGDAYAEIGRGYLDGGVADEHGPAEESPMQEAREVLEARSRARIRRGEEPLDVDAELEALLERWPETRADD